MLYVTNSIWAAAFPINCDMSMSKITSSVASAIIKDQECLFGIRDVGIQQRVSDDLKKDFTFAPFKDKYKKGDKILVVAYIGEKREKDTPIVSGKMEYRLLTIK